MTMSSQISRLSRAQILFATLAVTVGFAGAVQVANPDPASAMRDRCAWLLNEGHQAEGEGRQELADFYYSAWRVCRGL